jgi:flagellar protein FlaG
MAVTQVIGSSLPSVRPGHGADPTQGSGRLANVQGSRVASGEKAPKAISSADMEKAVATLNKLVAPAAQAIQFAIDDESGRTVVKVIDTDTRQVLRQVPSEEAIAISRVLDRLRGLLIQEKA